MSTATDLTDRLEKHYCKKKDQPGGILIRECGLNSAGPQRRCDALHVGFTSTSGKLLRGHEIKVTRADWLHELDQLDKADVWAEQCHEWYLVTPAADLVHQGELPPGWGHMVPSRRSAVRFDVIVAAERKGRGHTPSWDVVRSILARVDTLHREDRLHYIRDVRPEVEREARERAERSLRATMGDVMTRDEREALSNLARVEEQLGHKLGFGHKEITLDVFAKAVQLAASSVELKWTSPQQLASQLDRMAERIRQFGLLSRPPA